MKTIVCYSISILALLSLFFGACTTDIELDLPDPIEKIVVEASIESGSTPLVLLNKNFAYFGTFTIDQYQENFVKGATVSVSDGEITRELEEFCWSYLSDAEKTLYAGFLGIDLDSIPNNFEFCMYGFFNPLVEGIVGEDGKSYTLDINTAEGQHLYARTTIPFCPTVDSLHFEQHNNPEYPEYYQMWGQFSEPDTIGNFYRYYTKTNSGALLAAPNSVFDDLIINGQNDLPISFNKAEAGGPSEDSDFQTYGYFMYGDTVTLKWVSIDQASYRFWQSVEYSANSAGPFGTAVNVQSNIVGENVLGAWIGYGIGTEETIVVNEESIVE